MVLIDITLCDGSHTLFLMSLNRYLTIGIKERSWEMSTANKFSCTDYLFSKSSVVSGHISHGDYIEQPGTAYLKFCIYAKDSVEFCKDYFPKTEDGKHTIESTIRIQHIVNSTLALLMGHFETYQKYMFAGTFERTIEFESFDSNEFFRRVLREQGKGETLAIDTKHLLAYRDSTMAVGMLIADHVGSWHDPERVNSLFKAFGFNLCLFSNDDVRNLRDLWQIRHSIVHTAATLTRVDAEKEHSLSDRAERTIVFTNKFIYELTKEMHLLVSQANKRLRKEIEGRLPQSMASETRSKLLKFYDVDSPNSGWLAK